MKPQSKAERQALFARRTTADLLGRAAFYAFWGCGILGGAAAALSPNLILAAARYFVCRGSSLVEMATTTGGNTTSFVVYCDGMDRTIGSVGVILAGAFLLLFWLGLGIMLLRRMKLAADLP